MKSLYDDDWPLRHSRRKHCAGFHQSPLWQRQMVQSSTFTSIPAGMIVVPAKQFGPDNMGSEETKVERGLKRNDNNKKKDASPQRASLLQQGCGVIRGS